MTNTAPPASENSSIASSFQIPVPMEVRWALKLFWLSLALGIVQYLFFLPVAASTLPTDPTERGPAIFGLILPFMFFLFGAYLNIKIARRKNWARIIKLMFAAASLAFQLAFSPHLAGFEYISAGLPPALNFAAIYLLFVTSGRHWFHQTQPA